MHASIFEYRIRDIDDAGWSEACEELAPAFAATPGLLSKVWLRGEGDIRGGVYLWEDRAAFDAFMASDLGQALGSHPNMADLTIRHYGVDDEATRVTRGAPARVG